MRVRLIGGRAAGRDMDFPEDLPYVYVAIHEELPFLPSTEPITPETITIQKEEYKVEVIKFGDYGEQKYGIHPQMTIRDAFNELWRGYRKTVL